MNNDKITAKHRKQRKFTALLVSLVVLMTCVVGGTVAYLFTGTTAVTNTFTPAHVTNVVTEDFNGTVKKNVNVNNTSDIPVYIRVKLVTYRVNDQEQQIGGKAEIPTFTPGEGWIEKDGFYYYVNPVAAGESPVSPLIGEAGITLQMYTDADGGKQVIEVMSEAIQADGTTSDGTPAVTEAWGVTVTDGKITA